MADNIFQRKPLIVLLAKTMILFDEAIDCILCAAMTIVCSGELA